MSLCFLWMYWNNKDVASKWNVIRWFGIILTAISVISIGLHIAMISLEFGWNLNRNLLPLFPFDILAMAVIFLAIGVYSIIWTIKNKELAKVEKTSNFIIKKSTQVAVWVMICFSAYFFGGFLHSFNLLDSIDPNWWAMIPVVLSLTLMAFETVVFIIYKQGDEEHKQARHFKGLLAVLIATTVIYVWIGIASLISPYFLQNSCSGLYMLGFAIKIPFGLYFCAIGVIAPCTVSIVRYIKRYCLKK